MRIKKFRINDNKNSDSNQSEFRISFSGYDNPLGNYFSILVGINGTRKSRTLRDILDVASRRSKPGSIVTTSNASLEFWSESRDSESGASKIIALSGVATDRFPSRMSTRGRPRNFYRYVGPRTDNNLVSRTQSINQIAASILESPDRIKLRKRQLKHAFSILRMTSGILFSFSITEPKVGTWTKAKIKEKILESKSEWIDSEHHQVDALLNRCLEILKSSTLIELRLDLDDEVVIETSVYDLDALRLLLTYGFITVRDSYSYGDRNGELMALSEFSSGQWHMLSSLLSTAIIVEDNTLILVDEPENSLHPAWQQQYLRMLQFVIAGSSGVHVIVATHSPLVAASLGPDDAELICLRISNRNKVIAEPIKSGPFGWTSDEILQEVFGLESSRSVEFTKSMDMALKLFAKGDRDNPQLIKLVSLLEKTAPNLPDYDIAREIIRSLTTVINKPSEHS